jgi:hypothetical protein
MTTVRWFRRAARAAGIAVSLALGAIPPVKADDAPAPGAAIEMEPFFVAENGVPWRYVRLPGFQILSRYPDSTTRDFMRGLDRAQRLLGMVVPGEFQARFDVPHILILCDEGMMSPMSREVMVGSASQDAWGANVLTDASGPRVFPNAEVVDRDRIATLVTNHGGSLAARVVLINPWHVRLLLDRRTPQLPSWLITGVMSLYSDLYGANKTTAIKNAEAEARQRRRDEGAGKVAPKESDLVTTDSAATETYQQDTAFVYRIPPFVWISPEETKRVGGGAAFLRGYGSDKSALMSDLLTHEPASDSPDWKARSSLFVRWALDRETRPHANALTEFLADLAGGPSTERFVIDGTNSPHSGGFWRFADRASEEPATEAMFRESLGMGYAEAASRLADYLPVAIGRPMDFRLRPPDAGALPALRNATTSEITRIKADWERLAVAGINADFHDNMSSYVKESLTQAYNRGSRDPAMLAGMGLLDCDLDDSTDAKPLLEAAVTARVVGPRAYLELARIRYEELRPGDDSLLSADEASYILEPIEEGHLPSPPLREGYILAVKVWRTSAGALTRGQLGLLDAGLGYFPGDMELLFDAADLNAANGYRAEAAALAERGLRLSSTPGDRARFTRLRDRTAGRPPGAQ